MNTLIEVNPKNVTRKYLDKKKIHNVIFHIIMIFVSFIMIFPFLWMLSSSLKAEYDVMKFPPIWLPKPIRWENYINIFYEQPLGMFILNSIKITICVVLGQLFFSSLAAYSFARIRFKGRNILFFFYIGTLMIPGQVTLIPVYLLMGKMGWVDTHWPLIIPSFFSVFGVFLLRQFFLTIPKEFEESAELDGCNPFQTFIKIMFPQIKPALTTLCVFTFMGTWNDFMGPLIYLTTVDKFTLTLGLSYFRGIYFTQWNYVMAGGIISVIPILVLYLAAQRYFIEGITLTGIKG